MWVWPLWKCPYFVFFTLFYNRYNFPSFRPGNCFFITFPLVPKDHSLFCFFSTFFIFRNFIRGYSTRVKWRLFEMVLDKIHLKLLTLNRNYFLVLKDSLMITLNAYSKLLFFFMINMGIVLTLRAPDPLIIWIGLEINLLRFIPLMLESNSNIRTSNIIKYFLVQAITSLLILFSASNFILFKFTFDNSLIFLAVLIKLGIPPYHFWLPPVISSISWDNAFLLSSFQKIAPLIILLSIGRVSKLIFGVITTSLLIRCWGGLRQSNFRPLIAYSSIHHMGWCVLASIIRINALIYYFLIYRVSIYIIFKLFKTRNTHQFKSLYKIAGDASLALTFILLLSLAGLPPLLGFFPKILLVRILIHISTLMVIFLLIGSAINLFFYLNARFSFIATTSTLSYTPKLSIRASLFIIGVIVIFTPIFILLCALAVFN